MRTTLTLDPDVAKRLKERLAETKLPLKRVVNDALRVGLAAKRPVRRVPFKVEPHSCQFNPGIDLDKLNQLVDELEVEEFRRKYFK